jgi:hypothetical protein
VLLLGADHRPTFGLASSGSLTVTSPPVRGPLLGPSPQAEQQLSHHGEVAELEQHHGEQRQAR